MRRPRAEATTADGIATRIGSLPLWLVGGGLGLHCFLAGRTLRGCACPALIAGVIGAPALLPLAPNAEPPAPDTILPSLTAFGRMIGLAALWLSDGARILVGRFPCP